MAPNVSFRNAERISIGAGSHLGEHSVIWAGNSTRPRRHRREVPVRAERHDHRIQLRDRAGRRRDHGPAEGGARRRHRRRCLARRERGGARRRDHRRGRRRGGRRRRHEGPAGAVHRRGRARQGDRHAAAGSRSVRSVRCGAHRRACCTVSVRCRGAPPSDAPRRPHDGRRTAARRRSGAGVPHRARQSLQRTALHDDGRRRMPRARPVLPAARHPPHRHRAPALARAHVPHRPALARTGADAAVPRRPARRPVPERHEGRVDRAQRRFARAARDASAACDAPPPARAGGRRPPLAHRGRPRDRPRGVPRARGRAVGGHAARPLPRRLRLRRVARRRASAGGRVSPMRRSSSRWA